MNEAPFDTERLDRLMEAAGLDWILATSDHNTQYLLGGHRYFFHENMPAIGLSRYLPVVGYRRGRPHEAFYVAAANEDMQLALQPLWLDRVEVANVTSAAAADIAASAVRASAGSTRVGVEPSFLPADAEHVFRSAMRDIELVDATEVLDEQRCIKTPRELELVRHASEGIAGAMLATIARSKPGMAKEAVATLYMSEVAARGLIFDYVLMTAGRSLNRAPIGGAWDDGEILSIDSGGRYRGYVGDLCRMAVFGRPDSRRSTALREVDAVQQAARAAVRPGALGRVVYEAGEGRLRESEHAKHMRFVAHGMGLVSHEAPHLTSRAVAPYPAVHAARPLEAGMVLSIETHIADPELGFVKLEDTVIVTAGGYEAPGDSGRGWNVGGAPA